MDSYREEEDTDFTPEKSHPPLSPMKGAESLFLAGLVTDKLSANALASKLRANLLSPEITSSSRSVYTVATDDYATAAQDIDDLTANSQLFSPTNGSLDDYIPDLDSDSDSTTDETDKMTRSKVSKSPAVATDDVVKPPLKDAPTTTTTSSEEGHVDAASHVYEGVKGVWAWGKGVPLVSFGLGITEAVAGKVVSMAGSNLEEIDNNIKPQLSNFDNGVLNPVISKVITIVLGAAGKTEDIIKPIIIKILSPFGLIKNEAENPEMTSK